MRTAQIDGPHLAEVIRRRFTRFFISRLPTRFPRLSDYNDDKSQSHTLSKTWLVAVYFSAILDSTRSCPLIICED